MMNAFLKLYVAYFWAVQTVDIWKPFEKIVAFFLFEYIWPLTIWFSGIYRYNKFIVNVHTLPIYGQIMRNQIFERFLSPLNQASGIH